MPRFLDSERRLTELTDAVTRLVARGGLAAVTMRNISAETRVSQASLAHQLTNRDRLLRVVAYEHGAAMLDRILEQPWDRRLPAFLPVECRAGPGRETTAPVWDTYPFASFRPFGVEQMRVWLTWCNLAQTHEGVAESVEEIRQRQLLTLAGLVEGRPSARLDAVLAIIDGLRVATCRALAPMSLEAARDHLLHLVGGSIDQPAG